MSHFLAKLLATAAAWMCALGAIAVHAPAAHALPAPEARPDLRLFANGKVLAAARAADGSVIIGGDFSAIAGSPRSRLARLRPDGALDPAWRPEINGNVTALAVSPSGEIYVGGDFDTVNAVLRKNLAKIRTTGELDPDWNPAPDGNGAEMSYAVEIRALAVATSGEVFVGGRFEHIGGQARVALAKLTGTGSGAADPSWNPAPTPASTNPSPLVRALALDGTGAIYVGGRFQSIAGVMNTDLAKLSAAGTGTAVAGWQAGVSSTPYVGYSGVHAIAVVGAAVFVGGNFAIVGGQTRNGLAKLDGASGGVDPAWNPASSFSTSIRALAVAADGGALFAGGSFAASGGLARQSLAKLALVGSGAADANWQPDPDKGMPQYTPQVSALVAIDAGRVFAGGDFTRIAGVVRRGAAIIAASGTGVAAAAVDAERPGLVLALASQPGGGLIVGGEFVRADDAPRSNLLRLKPDGNLDPDWNPAPDFAVRALAIDPQGAVYAGGSFRTIGGLSRGRVAKLSASGAVDPVWNPDVGLRDDPVRGDVNALALGGNGALFVGGYFETVGGQARLSLAKVSALGAGDVDRDWIADVGSWDPSWPGEVIALAADRDGHLFAAGDFLRIGSSYRNDVAKLAQLDATVDAAWNPAPDREVWALAVDAQGAVYLGGVFSKVSWAPRCGLAKVAASGAGAVDPLWDPAESIAGTCEAYVAALALDGPDALHVGGQFRRMGGAARNGLAKVQASGIGSSVADWDPAIELRDSYAKDPWLTALSAPGGGRVYAGGGFSHAGGKPRAGLAGFAGEAVFRDGFDAD